MTKSVVKPNESILITATIDFSRFSGKQTKKFAIYTNDADHPKYSFLMSADVSQHVIFAPERIDVSINDPQTRSAKQMVNLKVLDESFEVEIVGIRTSSELISATCNKFIPDIDHVLEITIESPPDRGRLIGWVQVVTSHPDRYKLLTLPVEVNFAHN